jgi:hypothetical protein
MYLSPSRGSVALLGQLPVVDLFLKYFFLWFVYVGKALSKTGWITLFFHFSKMLQVWLIGART